MPQEKVASVEIWRRLNTWLNSHRQFVTFPLGHPPSRGDLGSKRTEGRSVPAARPPSVRGIRHQRRTSPNSPPQRLCQADIFDAIFSENKLKLILLDKWLRQMKDIWRWIFCQADTRHVNQKRGAAEKQCARAWSRPPPTSRPRRWTGWTTIRRSWRSSPTPPPRPPPPQRTSRGRGSWWGPSVTQTLSSRRQYWRTTSGQYSG